ncbi:MAG: right-handed parallel beta-helix repeat-containing protein [Candidatus Pacebacteria bacterium]|nr:right-handed parallel beta-helix repeat-containing protein [Candidatus Paceibacterota bacterium]
MKKNLFAVAVMAGVGLFALCSPVSASISECDYSKTYDDVKTLYVARDGSGDYNCDGTDDEVEINAAFQAVKNSGGAYDSVFLKSGTYIVGTKINMVTNSVFEGDKDAILKLKDQADWEVNVPMIGSTDIHTDNVEIKCFEADMNYDGNYSTDAYSCLAGWGDECVAGDFTCCEAYSTFRTTGKGYYNVAGFTYGKNYSMHDMYLHDGLGDGLNILHSSSVKFYDNLIYKMGHEGLYVKYSDIAEAFGNVITNRTNSGLRADDTNHVSFHDNDITAFDHWSAGGPGIEIVKDDRFVTQMNDIQIYNNYIHGTYGPGIWIIASGTNHTAADLAANIHHNIFSGTGINPTINWTAGILTSGFYNLTVENNVFDKVYNGTLLVSNAIATPPASSGYVITFRNNTITGTQPQRNTTSNGYGIINLLSGTHTVNSENNCFYDNYAGDYYGNVNSVDDIHTDPLYADAADQDYHLQSAWGRWNGSSWVKDAETSPCIDAGYAASDYSLEPESNGGRINIGRYGNTVEASLSFTPVLIPVATTYDLTINGGSGSGSYVEGQNVVIIADASATGKVFDKWIGDTTYVSNATAAIANVTMPADGVSLTATYKDVYYNLTVDGGTGSGSYIYGQQISVTADAPSAGKLFDKWTGDISYITSAISAATTVTMPTGAAFLTATYKDAPVTTYDLTVSGGSGSGSYVSGTKVTITAATITGKVFVGWIGSTSYLSSTTAATATVIMPAKAITLTATYKTAYYLTIYNGSGSGWYAAGTKVTIAANAPAVRQVFYRWTGSTSYVARITSATTTVTMPSKSISLTATYSTSRSWYYR